MRGGDEVKLRRNERGVQDRKRKAEVNGETEQGINRKRAEGQR